MSQLSIHSITLEETKRFTGGMDDPARVVAFYAGVATSDASSDIIVRGNSPKYMQWRLDGAEISSPYHLDDHTALQLIKIPQKNESFVIFKLDMLLIG
jgi:hypothetical protein